MIYSWRENEKSMVGGENEGGLETRNDRMKVFISLRRAADMSRPTFGMIDDRDERWTGRKSISNLTRTAYGSFGTYS